MLLVKILVCAALATGERGFVVAHLRFPTDIFYLISQVHEIHPSHAFLDVPERPPRSRSEPSVEKIKTDPSGEEPCRSYFWYAIISRLIALTAMVHPGVKCAQYVFSFSSCFLFLNYPNPHSCMRDIVGARFHCAICASVDICSNCEAAGLPGNLDDDDGGHSSSHIMIKVT